MNYFNYFSEIEEAFARRRGKSLLLSPMDWSLIESWQEKGIPLHIVLRGMDRVFDNVEKSQTNKNIKSLSYCADEIESQYKEWLASQVGKNSEDEGDENSSGSVFGREDLERHLDGVHSELSERVLQTDGGLRETLSTVLKRLDEIRQRFTDAEGLEKELIQLEKLIEESLLRDTRPDVLARLSSEIENQLGAHKSQMTPEAYKDTFDLLLLKKLREETEIPSLSLFYL